MSRPCTLYHRSIDRLQCERNCENENQTERKRHLIFFYSIFKMWLTNAASNSGCSIIGSLINSWIIIKRSSVCVCVVWECSVAQLRCSNQTPSHSHHMMFPSPHSQRSLHSGVSYQRERSLNFHRKYDALYARMRTRTHTHTYPWPSVINLLQTRNTLVMAFASSWNSIQSREWQRERTPLHESTDFVFTSH